MGDSGGHRLKATCFRGEDQFIPSWCILEGLLGISTEEFSLIDCVARGIRNRKRSQLLPLATIPIPVANGFIVPVVPYRTLFLFATPEFSLFQR